MGGVRWSGLVGVALLVTGCAGAASSEQRTIEPQIVVPPGRAPVVDGRLVAPPEGDSGIEGFPRPAGTVAVGWGPGPPARTWGFRTDPAIPFTVLLPELEALLPIGQPFGEWAWCAESATIPDGDVGYVARRYVHPTRGMVEVDADERWAAPEDTRVGPTEPSELTVRSGVSYFHVPDGTCATDPRAPVPATPTTRR